MCINCSPDRDDEDDYEEDYEDEEIDMEERWENFYEHIDYFDYELAEMSGARRTDVEDYEPSVEYLKAVRDAFKNSFESAIDEDGASDVQRRLEMRNEWETNAENSLPTETHEVMEAGVQLGVYESVFTPVHSLEQAFRMALIELGVALQGDLMRRAHQYEDADYSASAIR